MIHDRERRGTWNSETCRPLYQGRFQAFPIQEDKDDLGVCRYAERNALRANLVARAEDWRWSRLGLAADANLRGKLSSGPLPYPRNWLATSAHEKP